MVKIIHYECGKTAFYVKHIMPSGSIIYAKDIILLDGTQPEACSPMICGSCGKHMESRIYNQENLDWKDWFINDEIRNKNLDASVALTGESA